MSLEEEPQPQEKPGFGALVKSILAAAIECTDCRAIKTANGIFNREAPWPFIIGGIVFTLLFIATVASIVGIVLSSN